MEMRGIAAVGEHQRLAALVAQLLDHRSDGVAHVIANRPAAKGQAAKGGDRPVDRPVDHAPRHFGHTRKA